jgi:osmotically-inducible protein OsmY
MAVLSLFFLLIQTACASDTVKPDDATVGFWVRQALLDDPRVLSSDVAVCVDSGIVTLTGSVRDLAEKTFAEKEAMKINGVRGVIDKLEIKTIYRPDEEIRDYVEKRIVNCMALPPGNLKVTCLDGTVTLRGEVPSWSDSHEAILLASEISGVKAVENHLKITYPVRRTDEEIQLDVSEALSRDVYLAGLPLDVTVKAGEVTLTGLVGNSYEKDRAGEDAARVWNVKRVNNELAVDPYENEGVRKKMPLPDDGALEKAVHDELVKDLRIMDPYSISADADYGQITLKGSVPSYGQKRLALEDAKNVVGVGWVTNQLVVKSSFVDDLATQEKVRSALETDYALFGDKIEAFVDNGIATLNGSVHTYYERNHAEDVAARVPGVIETMNHLKVKSRDMYSDGTLKKHIQDRLMTGWQTRNVADDIHVQVKGGEVTLTGTVDSWGERKEADRLAFFTSGVRDVDNRLTVAKVNYPWGEKRAETVHGPDNG